MSPLSHVKWGLLQPALCIPDTVNRFVNRYGQDTGWDFRDTNNYTERVCRVTPYTVSSSRADQSPPPFCSAKSVWHRANAHWALAD